MFKGSISMFKVLSLNIGDKLAEKQLEELLNSNAGWEVYDMASSQGRCLFILTDEPGEDD